MRVISEKKIKGKHVDVDMAVVDNEIKSDVMVTLYINFHGTANWKQWLFNFCFWPFLFRAPYRDMPDKYSVSWGFFKGYKEVKDEIYHFINLNLKEITYVQIAGYSRGGACASFCAEDIAYKYVLPYYCETYGAPKTLSKKGLEVYKKRKVDDHIMAYEFGSDIVCKVPPFYKKPGRIVVEGGKRRFFWDIPGMIKDHLSYDVLKGGTL